MCSNRKYLALPRIEEEEKQDNRHNFDTAGALNITFTEYKKLNPVIPSPISIDTSRDRRNLPVEGRFEEDLKKERSEATVEDKMEELLFDDEEEMVTEAAEDTGVVPKGTIVT